MADDLTDRGPRDRERINLQEGHEVRYWTKELGCSEIKLKQAVDAVGVMAEDVKTWLAKQ
ncbi:hypothetical protein ASC80_10675 [Afipia sp. Root123D2]|uniref:DUF3606 domain-containing protein n=1 Tax=Afipia sp. Root123D2 TaxID=1736436 RepID=UPI0007011562|nr:DUF3606 domain-containing protein [Afipia sp. Root123D2]KQW20678.1 hypothetical protein ASC80_10675 [Afipia sp. Root123D2]